MNQLNTNVYLRYSRILSIAFIGHLLYSLQIFMLDNNLTNVVYLSGKNNPLKKNIIRKLSKKRLIFCQTYKLSKVLKELKTNVTFDIKLFNVANMARSSMYDLMWTLVFCKSVTIASKKSLGSFLPVDFPIYESKK